MRSRSWFLRLSFLAFAMTLLIGSILLRASNQNGVSLLASDIESLQPVIVAIRWSLVLVLIVSWPSLVRRAASRGYFSDGGTQAMHAARWRCLLWIVCLELLVGMNSINALVDSLKAALQ